MISVIRNADGTIKTYSERPEPFEVLAPCETLQQVNTTFAEYARRLVLSAAGRSGETVHVSQSSGDVTVEVSCPGEPSVALEINGTVETLPLIDGRAALLLGTEETGTFVLKPADASRYCPAGQSLLVVEVG
jgi:hypothetical protein